MMMEEKWDSDAMLAKRARLAHDLLKKVAHDRVQEAGVMDFFESLAILDRLGLVHKDLVWNTFSFYATRWWTACKDYAFQERDKQREHVVALTLTEFEAFAGRLYDREARERHKERAGVEPTSTEINTFLTEELALNPEESKASHS